MDEEVLIPLADKYGLSYTIPLHDKPYSFSAEGVYRSRNIKIDEYGMADAVYGPPPYAVFVTFSKPTKLKLSFEYYSEPTNMPDQNWPRQITYPALRGRLLVNWGDRAELAYLLDKHPSLLSGIEAAKRFYFDVYYSEPPTCEIALMPLYPAFRAMALRTNLEDWSRILELGLQFADVLELTEHI